MKAAQETPLKPKREFIPASDASWFRLNVGRGKNADPKWLVPLICRLGHITKAEIGVIKIFDRETKFEISKAAADKFATTVNGVAEGDVRIEPTSPPSFQDRGPRRDFAPKPRSPFHKDRGDGKPGKPKWESRGDKPRHEGKPKWDARPRPERAADEARPKWQGKPNPGGEWVPKAKWAGKPQAEAAARAKWEAQHKGKPAPAGKKPFVKKTRKKANG